MASVAVVGNCQAPSVADILARLFPGVSATAFSLASMKTEAARAHAASSLQAFDLVFTQPLTRPKHGPLRATEVQARHTNVVLYPAVIFKGFHPDFFLGSTQTGSVAGNYHSCLVAAAFFNGVPVERVHALFNTFNLAKLGYFREYAAGRDYLLREGSELGYDLSESFTEWERSGVFMHTPNHPSIAVLTSIAVAAARRAGLSTNLSVAEVLGDRLGHMLRLPVYPPIAERLRLDSEPNFMVWRRKKTVRIFDLQDYITQMYELYGSAPKSFFEHKDIQRAAVVLS